jgi:propanol-preferring alcohol dehydrogenase
MKAMMINAIRKEERDKEALLRLRYQDHLRLEKEIKTVANVTHLDIAEFLPLAAQVPLRPEVQTYPLAEANRALLELKQGPERGAKVLLIG